VFWLPEEDREISRENDRREELSGTDTSLPPDIDTQWPVAFADSFDNNTNNWSVGQGQIGAGQLERFIENGKYYWVLHTGKQNEILGVNSYPDSMTDFITSIDARFLSGEHNNATPFGIAFRRTDEGFFYIFVVNNNGFFRVSLYKNGWTELINWTPSPAYKRGEANRLMVRAEGSKFDFWINDEHVGEVENNQLSEGYLGLVMEDYLGDVVVEFDNIEVRTP
jgi:hypothetical protein